MKADPNITNKDLEKWFTISFGTQYNKMQKEKLARMLYNLSNNYMLVRNELEYGAKIWLRMKRQRDHFRNRLRYYIPLYKSLKKD